MSLVDDHNTQWIQWNDVSYNSSEIGQLRQVNAIDKLSNPSSFLSDFQEFYDKNNNPGL